MDQAFEVHMLNERGKEKARKIALAFDDLLTILKEDCENGGREFAIVRTKLEEGCFFAKKAMAKQADNQA